MGAAAVATSSSAGPGQSASYEGRIVKEVQFPNVHSEATQQRFRQLIAATAGGTLDRESIRQSIQRLHATGRFADIRAETEVTPDGQVILSFVTQPNFFVASVDAVGLPPRPTKGQVIDAAKLQLGELFNPDRLERASRNIQRLMEENGYNRATLETAQQPDPDRQQLSIVFVIHPGIQARVGQITVTGDPSYSAAQIQNIAKMHTGDPVSEQRVGNALDRLRKKYQKQNRLLAQVSITSKLYRQDVNQVDYHLEVDPGPKVEILAEGFKVRRGVLKQNVPVFEENAVDDDLLNEGRRNLLNYLQARGYFEATVGMRKNTAANKTDLQIIYVIDAGSRHKLVKIEIKGNKYFRTEDLRTRMRVQTSGRLLENGRFSQALLTGDVRGFEQLYRNNGFPDIKITSNVTDNYGGRPNHLAVEIEVNEGEQTRVGAFHMEGNRAFSENRLQDLISTAPGQPFSESYIAQDRDNLLNYYFNRGFPQASFEASAKPMEGDARRMDVTFTLHEGDQIFVDQTYVSGTHYTKPFVVTRELEVQSGAPLSQLDMLESQRRLYDLGIFNQVDTAVQNPNGVESQKDVLVRVQEAKRYTFNYGVGLEFQTGQPSAVGTNQALGQTGVGGRVSLDVTRLNFRGRNHTITFKSDIGSLQQRGLISYNAPRWFNNPDWKLSLTAFYDNTLDVTTFTSQRLEGSVQAEETISQASTIDYRFVYRRVKATNIAISPSEIPLLSLPVRVGEPGFSYIRNKRDSDLESTKGSYTTVDAAVAAGFFGSEADFSRILAQNSTYHAFGKNRPRDKKFVFAPPGQACADPTQTNCPGESVIPLAERFFTGGGNSHRGFGLNQAGPRDPTTGFPLGGSALFVNNLELRFPPANLPFFQDNISFAVFEDAGNVFTDGRAMLDNLLRWKQKNPQLCLQQSTAAQCNFSYVSHALGVGVRYRTPIGPVRFDFGYNLNPPAFPSSQTVTSVTGQGTTTFVPQHATHFNVYFSIGQSF
jgi:outer membrane protein assembly complex protein YaeT